MVSPLFHLVVLLVVALASFLQLDLRRSWRSTSSARQSSQTSNPRTNNVEPVHVVFSSTMDSVAGVKATVRSIQEHIQGPVEFYFIGDEPLSSMPGASIRWFNLTTVAKEYHLIEYMNVGFPGRDDKINVMHANYARFAVPELLQRYVPDATRVLYLDNDVIVLCDIHELLRHVLLESDKGNTTYAMAAVPRYATERRTNPIRGLHSHKEKQLRKEFGRVAKSFNAGVYVMHLKRWREQKISERIRQLALRNREEDLYRGGSQPPLNLIIGESFEDLSIGWNTIASEYERFRNGESATEQVCLIHYKGGTHPWKNVKNFTAKDVWSRYGTQIDAIDR